MRLGFSDNEIGGAVVLQSIRTDDGTGQMVQRMRGYRLSAEAVLKMPISNRNAMVSKKIIELFPKAPDSAARAAQGERHVVSAGFGRFDVIEGRKLNQASLSKEEAQALAGTKKAKAATKGKAH